MDLKSKKRYKYIIKKDKKNSSYGSRTRLSTLRGSRTKPIFEGAKKKAESPTDSAWVPQGGFEPPQSEPESEVLPLHNRGISEYYNNNFYSLCQ